MTFNSIKENDVVILRIVKSKIPNFEHQAYIYCMYTTTLNINKIYDGCYLGLWVLLPHQIELSCVNFFTNSQLYLIFLYLCILLKL